MARTSSITLAVAVHTYLMLQNHTLWLHRYRGAYCHSDNTKIYPQSCDAQDIFCCGTTPFDHLFCKNGGKPIETRWKDVNPSHRSAQMG